MDQPDAADVEAAAHGDEAAFERLVRSQNGRVWRYVVHLVGDAALAEDISQEVFLRAHRKLGTLRDPRRFVPWLFSIARNAAYDAGRKRQRRPLELLGDRDVSGFRQSPDPHLGVEVNDALAQLDETLREAIVIVGVIGYTYQEAGEIIGVPAGTVKSRVFRARRRLLELLDTGDGA